jgi:hypothetical protein
MTPEGQICTAIVRSVEPSDRRRAVEPSFGHAYSEIAAVANYVTARFRTKDSSLTARDVAKLRDQVAD